MSGREEFDAMPWNVQVNRGAFWETVRSATTRKQARFLRDGLKKTADYRWRVIHESEAGK